MKNATPARLRGFPPMTLPVVAMAAMAAAVSGATITGARAQEPPAATLPGGASSLTEAHRDWTVSCGIARQDEEAARLCILSQQQTDARGQRALAIELRPSGEGADGVLMLPFGLAVTRGVSLMIDEADQGAALPFSTCLPAGCVVPIIFDAATTDALRQGASLGVSASIFAHGGDGGDVSLAVSLAGFASALDRAAELMRPQ